MYDILLLKAILCLALVILMIYTLIWALKKCGFNNGVMITKSANMIVYDVIGLGVNRRIVLVKRQNMHYMIMLGNNDLLIDSWHDEKHDQE